MTRLIYVKESCFIDSIYSDCYPESKRTMTHLDDASHPMLCTPVYQLPKSLLYRETRCIHMCDCRVRRLGYRSALWAWLRLVGSLKLWVSTTKKPYKRDYILQKRPIIEGAY